MNPIKKKQLEAFQAGQKAALDRALPMIERKYKIRLMSWFGIWLFVAFALGTALGASVTEWALCGDRMVCDE